jgi:hypothetical protein
MISYYADTVVEFGTVDFYKRFRDDAVLTVQQAEQRAGGKPLELTEEERWAAAFLAGVPIETQFENGTFTVTTDPCGVAYDGRQWFIYRKRKEPSQ